VSDTDRGPTLQTDRLILRRWEARHLEPLARLNGSAEVMKYFVAPLTYEETVAFIARLEEGFEKSGFGFWAVELKESGESLGACGLLRILWDPLAPQVEVGWRFSKEHWGKGYATVQSG
jgi:RimJ/RimL family protein N-acetyltransferase